MIGEDGQVEKEMLESYRSKRDEILELKDKLKHLGEDDRLIGNDVVMDYRQGFPKPQSVVGYDYEKERRMRESWEKKIVKLGTECQEVEEFIEDIQDSLTRRIFRMHYIDGMTQKQIGKAVHMDRSRVSRKIDDFIKNAHKAQKAHL
jgi:predicted XRE-type DNA-binding protein